MRVATHKLPSVHFSAFASGRHRVHANAHRLAHGVVHWLAHACLPQVFFNWCLDLILLSILLLLLFSLLFDNYYISIQPSWVELLEVSVKVPEVSSRATTSIVKEQPNLDPSTMPNVMATSRVLLRYVFYELVY